MTDLEKKVKKQIKALAKNIELLSTEEKEMEIILVYTNNVDDEGRNVTIMNHSGIQLMAHLAKELEEIVLKIVAEDNNE